MSRSVKIVCVSFLSTISFVIAANITLDDISRFNLTHIGGFNRKTCYRRTFDYLNNGTLDRDSEVFFRDDSGRVISEDEDITLTLPGCWALCGAGRGWFWDIGPRLTTWLIPILLLISNVELSPLDKRRFFAIIHLIGDPIDSIWSLVHKIDAWDQCYTLAAQYASSASSASSSDRDQRVIATVFAGIEETRGPDVTSDYFRTVVNMSGLNEDAKYHQWSLAAVELADSRTYEILRATLAIILFFYQVIASFIEEVGGDQTSPPGGRIGTAMFISWLVPLVLLSNLIGGFTSRRSASNVLIRFAEHTGLPLDFPVRKSTRLGRRKALETDYFQSLSWSGAIYTFRTWKTGYLSGKPDRWRTALLFCISIAPICIGMTGSFIILWQTLPVGLACRHVWVISVFLSYFVSSFITWVSNSDSFATGVYHWHFVLYKDGLIGITSLLMIFLSSSGLFNSCFCLSGSFYYRGRSHVSLNSDPFYERKNKTIYPAVVAICLFLQLAVFALIAGIWWNGLQVMRWSEKARADDWAAAGGATRSSHGHAAGTQHLVGCPVRQRAQEMTGGERGMQHLRPATA
jgi:hypothetical protein